MPFIFGYTKMFWNCFRCLTVSGSIQRGKKMKKIPVFKKLLSVFLAIVMLFSMLPTLVFNASAAGGTDITML